jgi:DNA-binding CsgD family transcriptional regulator
VPYVPYAPPAASSLAAAVRLTPAELLVLQLLARGYAPRQVACLIGCDDPGVADALAGAIWALGAVDAADAVAVARRRRLIV